MAYDREKARSYIDNVNSGQTKSNYNRESARASLPGGSEKPITGMEARAKRILGVDGYQAPELTPAQKWAQQNSEALSKLSAYSKKRNGGWTKDASGGTLSTMQRLLQEYEKFDPDTKGQLRSAYKNLQEVYGNITEINSAMSHFASEDAYDRYRSNYSGDIQGYDPSIFGLTEAQARDIRMRLRQADEQAQTDADTAAASAAATVRGNAGRNGVYAQNGIGGVGTAASQYGAVRGNIPFSFGSDAADEAYSEYSTQQAASASAGRRVADYRYSGNMSADDYYEVRQSAGFDNTDTSYHGPTAEELEQRAFQAQIDLETTGTGENMDRVQINDKLGLYRTATKEQKMKLDTGGVLGDVIREGTGADWDLMDDSEVKTYYWLLNNRGQEDAYSYLDGLAYALNKRANDAQIEELEGASAFEKTMLVAASVPAQLIANFTDAAAVGGMVARDEVNEYSHGLDFSRFARNIRAVTQSDIGQWVGDRFGDTAAEYAQNTYSAILSGIDSYIGATTLGGGLYQLNMSLGAGAQKAIELAKSGASPAQIYAGAAVSGLIEAITEKYSIEEFMNNKNAPLLKAIIQQSIAEGSEEVASEILNLMSDALIQGSNSDKAELVRQLMSQGYGKLEAEQMATMQAIQEIWWAGYGGLVSGGFMEVGRGAAGGAYNGFSRAVDSITARGVGADIIRNNGQGQLSELANQVADEQMRKKLVQQAEAANLTYADAAQKGIKGRQLERNVGKTAQAIKKQSVKDAQNAKSESFHAKAEQFVKDNEGKITNPGKAADVLTKAFNDEGFMPGDRAMLNALAKVNGTSVQGLLDQIEKSSLNDAALREAKANLNAYKVKLAANGIDLSGGTVESKFSVNEDAANDQSYLRTGEGKGEPINISGVAGIENGKLMLTTDDGNTVAASDVVYGTNDQAVLYSTIQDISTSSSMAKSLANIAKNSDINFNDFNSGIREAFNLGANGVAFGDINSASMASRVDENTRRMAWKAGQVKAAENRSQKSEKLKKGEVGRSKQGGIKFEGVDPGSKNLTELQKANIELAQAIAALGLDVTVFASDAASRADRTDAQYRRNNGYYFTEDGSFRFDLNSGDNAQGIMAYTVAHELTHFAREFNPEQFNTFANTVIAEMEKEGISWNNILDQSIRRQQSLGAAEGKTETELYDLAYDEAFAELMEGMLAHTDAIDRISQKIHQQDATLWEKIKSFLANLVGKLNELYKDFRPEGNRDQKVFEAVTKNQAIVDAWVNAVTGGIENYNRQQKKNTSGEVLFSIRNTKGMIWEKQIKSALEHNGVIRHGDTLVVLKSTPVFLQTESTKDLPLAIPLSVITKSQNGKNNDHKISSTNLMKLHSGIENAIAVIDNPGRNSIAFITPLNEDGGKITVFFDKNTVFDGDNVHKATSIHRRTNFDALLNNTSDDAVIYVKNKDEFENLVGMADSIPAAYKGKIKFVAETVSQDGGSVKPESLKSSRNTENDFTSTPQFRQWFGDSVAVNADGTPMVLYHQTSSEFTVFDPRHDGAGTSDDETPFGIFLKSSNKNIGLRGDKQMALYASIQNPLVVNNREHLNRRLAQLSDSFVANKEKRRALDSDYQKRLDDNEAAQMEYIKRWKEEHPGESSRKLYNDDRFHAMLDADESILDEWKAEGKKLDIASKEEITKTLEEKGFDGVIIREDKGSFGRTTDAYIALHPEQVKSVTDNVGTFDRDNPDIRFSSRNISRETMKANLDAYKAQRDVEAKAMKAVYEAERKQMEQYHKRQMADLQESYSDERAEIEKEFIRLVKAYDAEQQKAQRNGEKADKKIDGLRDKLKKEAQAHRDDNAMWQKEFNRLMNQYDAAGRNISRLEQDITKRKAAAKAKVESHRKVEMRHKIQRTVDTLNRYFNNSSKTMKVPENLRGSIALALDAINNYMGESKMDGYSERMAEYNYQMRELMKDPSGNAEKIEALKGKISKLNSTSTKFKDALQNMLNSYHDTMNEAEDLYDMNVESYIQYAFNKVGDTEYRNLSLEQMDAVLDAYRSVLQYIRNKNQSFADKQNYTIGAMATQAIQAMDEKGKRNKQASKGKKLREQFYWNNLKPYYAFQRLENKVFQKLYQNMRTGEDTWYKDVNGARAYFIEQASKFGYFDWDMERMYDFEAADGTKFQLNLDEVMSLYAYSRRDQAIDHLMKGGVVLDSSTERTTKDRLGIKHTESLTDSTAYNLTYDTIMGLSDMLTVEQRLFAVQMQKYLSEVMGGKGNEVSMQLYDIKLFKEQYYWPLRSASDYSQKARESRENPSNTLKNSSFTKKTVEHANNPVEISGFMKTWTTHVNDMSMYHAFTLPMEDFYRVYNWRSDFSSEETRSSSIRARMRDTYGDAALSYIDTFLKDLNGGVRSDPRETWFKSGLSKFKKGAVMASMSVTIQQPSAIGRAFAIIDPKFFAGAKVESTKESWEQCKQYAPIAGIKEMGRFEMDMGRSTTDYIMAQTYTGFGEKVKGALTDSEYREELMGLLPEKADQITWTAIWEAAKRQTAAQNPGLKGETLLQKAGELFTQCIEQTQVYDSVFSRSGNMRSKSMFMQMATSFMSEPTTTANMMSEAFRQFRAGDKATAAKTVAAVGTAIVINSMLASIVYAGRDDDEDKTFWEKYFGSLAGEMLDGINPFTYIPGVKDIYSMFQGFDVERSDMSLWSDAITAINRMKKTWMKRKDGMTDEELQGWWQEMGEGGLRALDAIGNLLGQPIRNLRRDGKALLNLFHPKYQNNNWGDTNASLIWDSVIESAIDSLPEVLRPQDADKYAQLYKAVTGGDDIRRKRAEGRYSTKEKLDTALRTALRENDPRIKEAAEALVAGDNGKYMTLMNAIVAEGYFDKDIVKGAISNAANKITSEHRENLIESDKRITQAAELIISAQKDQADDIIASIVAEKKYSRSTIEAAVNSLVSDMKVGSYYSVDDYVYAMSHGIGGADAIAKDIIHTMTLNGKTQAEAELAFRNSVKSHMRDAIEDDEITDDRAFTVLMQTGVFDDEEKARMWIYRYRAKAESGADSVWTEAQTKWYIETGAPAGIDKVTYEQYLSYMSLVKGYDENGDGKVDRLSKQREAAEYIDLLPISDNLKQMLFKKYVQKGKYNHLTPWYKRGWRG